MFNFTADIDYKALQQKLINTNLKMPALIAKMQRGVNREVIKQAKKNFKAQFNSNNHSFGNETVSILKSFVAKSFKKDRTKSYVKNTAFYSRFLENGAVINPKGENYLVYKINGHFVKSKSVRIEAKPFLGPAFEQYWHSKKSTDIMQKIMQDELNRYWNKK